ncbi:hypothetical protein RchiOBHm_Chr3g0490931 [Rosa chinensis]|uniref:Uncharacterized protein n=1 Tax=Rosa chinensis TaxID=74649 RepID=A0A2P6RG43_ROSCH|nr:hypothetical protein RchiOBHm_Chr3g0490931 [Rosa chinensis]
MPPKSKPQQCKTPKLVIIPTPENPTPSEFSTAISRTTVAQISALETLTHVAIDYLVAIAKSSASYSLLNLVSPKDERRS